MLDRTLNDFKRVYIFFNHTYLLKKMSAVAKTTLLKKTGRLGDHLLDYSTVTLPPAFSRGECHLKPCGEGNFIW
jgi:hypothetical protein